MDSTDLVAELVAALAGLGGLLVFLFRWLIATLSTKLDRAVGAAERFETQLGELITLQRRTHEELLALSRRLPVVPLQPGRTAPNFTGRDGDGDGSPRR